MLLQCGDLLLRLEDGWMGRVALAADRWVFSAASFSLLVDNAAFSVDNAAFSADNSLVCNDSPWIWARS